MLHLFRDVSSAIPRSSSGPLSESSLNSQRPVFSAQLRSSIQSALGLLWRAAPVDLWRPGNHFVGMEQRQVLPEIGEWCTVEDKSLFTVDIEHFKINLNF